MARPGRLELPTLCLEGRRSIQLSYGRTGRIDSKTFITRRTLDFRYRASRGRADVAIQSAILPLTQRGEAFRSHASPIA